MKKYIALTILSILHFVGLSQDSKGYFSELIPPSPTTSELGKFGEVPVGKYNGTANIGVPIHQISFQEISIPISLSYNTGGIKVSQEASWVGLGWNLSANAIISRQIKGYDDLTNNEGAVGYLFSNNYTYPLSATQQQELVTAYSTNPIDTEPDLFNISLFGQSIKFTLPKKGNTNTISANVLNNANTKVFYNTSTKSFEIINSLGYRFFFGSKEFTTAYRSGLGGSGTLDTEESALGVINYQTADGSRTRHKVSSWHLDKIQAPNGEELFFSYQKGFHMSYPSFSESRDFNLCDFGGTVNGLDHIDGEVSTKTITGYITGFESLYLNQISGRFGSVTFGLTDREDISSRFQTPFTFPLAIPVDINQKPKKLSSIVIKDYNGVIRKSASLTHTYFNADKNQDTDDYKKEKYLRLKLDEVVVLNQKFSFDYISSNSLPAKNSKAEDFWGFYNGKDNTNRIPSFGRVVRCAINNKNAFLDFEGVNRGSDITYGKIGLLEKVTYPTKGYTVFEYESNKATIDKPTVDYSDPYTNSTGFSYNYQYLKRTNLQSFYTPIGSGSIFTINSAQDLPFSYNFKASTGFQCGYNCHLGAAGPQYVFRIENVNDPSKVYEIIKYANVSSVSEESLNLPNGTYKLKINSYDWPPGGFSAAVSAKNPKAFYIKSPDVNSFPFEEFEVGGARVKSVTNKDHNNQFITKKTYTYTEGKYGTTVSSGVLMNELVYHSKAGVYDYTPQDFGGRFTMSSGNPLNLDYAAQGSHIGYSFVEERNETEDGSNNGVIRSNFVNTKNQHLSMFIGATYEYALESAQISQSYTDVHYGNAYLIGVDPISFDYKNGNLFTEEIIDVNGETKSFINYATYQDVTLTSVPVVRAHLTTVNVIASYGYTQKGQLSLLTQKENSEYHNNKVIKTVQTNTYNERYLPELSTTSTSENNTILKSYTYYPFDSENGISTKPYMQDLVNQNRIAIPVFTKNLKDNTVLNERLTFFDEFSTTNMILPSKIQDSKQSGNLEDRFFFHDYDANNNVLEVSLTKDTHTVYVWGYNKQYAIAKIQNTTYAEVAGALGITVAALKNLDEGAMSSLNSLREKLPQAMTSTYTYDPIIGVTSMTDPRGYTMYYHYDLFNRLEFVKDADGNLVSENKYNYKN
ncbi:hypothetical protein D1816_01395 [Aquimarina sp. AD10]|uniref:hypothetical protein n=1 Tax=Aquimarina sp. AD10 TaxID=1714849 RepID=UPI000E4A92E0|nr:hypothetical protein [Aquimarina sp. AD10]AXT59059.1 hypothetical protein D1816_01395 [Aquimarina sp. AD10]RKM93392.1 hypothetical protein D7033_19850 [Aquimarina sp. AD10]